MSAKPSIVTLSELIFIACACMSIFWVKVPRLPISMVAVPSELRVSRAGPLGVSMFIWPGFSGAASSTGAGSGDSFSFGPPLPTTSEYTGLSCVSMWACSLKRSCSNDFNISGASSFFAPSGIVATMSNRSLASQAGPSI